MFTSGILGKIIIVDEDSNITDLLKYNLHSEGFGVDIVPRANDVDINSIADARLVIVDAMNQTFSGLDLIREIKASPITSLIPVIVCTANDSEDLLLNAFDAGADDFVGKPFSLRELLARIRAILRRHPMLNKVPPRKTSMVVTFENVNLTIDSDSQKVVEDGLTVPLTKTEYAILVFLIRHQNSFFSREEICDAVWKDDAGSNARIVDTNISRLRKKLGESGKYLINRYGMGYAFVNKMP